MELIKKYFPNLTPVQIERFEMLGPLYSDWNSKINVISRKDIDMLYERHVLHSLGIAKVVEFAQGSKVLDVGTGGGFPGIPLAILYPGSYFHLIDSIGKKIRVVEAVVTELGLENVTFEKVRAENLNEKFDVIVSRAVTSFPVFYGWVKNLINRQNKNDIAKGIIYLKGGDFERELKPFGKRAKIYPLSSYFEEPFFETKKVVFIR